VGAARAAEVAAHAARSELSGNVARAYAQLGYAFVSQDLGTAELAGKDAAYDLAAAQYNQTLVAALNQVADEFSALQSLDAQIAAQQRARDAASAAWDLARQRYQAGIGSYLEALSVRQQLLAAERGSAALAAQRVDMSLQLIQALGGGYQPRADHAPPTTPTHS
jgi:outer membrane protein TolC